MTKEEKLMQTLVRRSWADAEFKRALIADPIRTMEMVYGAPLKIPEGKNIVVQDQTDESIIYITIPAEPNMEDVELNEAQLEIVAGGGVLVDPSLQGLL